MSRLSYLYEYMLILVSKSMHPFQHLCTHVHKCLCESLDFAIYTFSKRISDQGYVSLGLRTHGDQCLLCVWKAMCVSISGPQHMSVCVSISKFACVSVWDFCSLCHLECVCVCVRGDMDMCIPVCLFPWLLLPSQSGWVPILSLSLTPTHPSSYV